MVCRFIISIVIIALGSICFTPAFVVVLIEAGVRYFRIAKVTAHNIVLEIILILRRSDCCLVLELLECVKVFLILSDLLSQEKQTVFQVEAKLLIFMLGDWCK